MKAKIAIVCVMVLWTSVSHAQLKKCIAADGKVTYSDVQCSSEKKETAVRGGMVSTVDGAQAKSKTSTSQDFKYDPSKDPIFQGSAKSSTNSKPAQSKPPEQLYTMPSQLAIERQRNGNK